MKHWWKWYGAVVILLVLWIASTVLFYWSAEDVVAGDAGVSSHFWAGLHANLQAEWAHLLFSTVILVGFGRACFKRGRQDSDRIEHKLDEVLRQLRPAETVPVEDVNLGALRPRGARDNPS